jgi:hypothetical protein
MVVGRESRRRRLSEIRAVEDSMTVDIWASVTGMPIPV